MSVCVVDVIACNVDEVFRKQEDASVRTFVWDAADVHDWLWLYSMVTLLALCELFSFEEQVALSGVSCNVSTYNSRSTFTRFTPGRRIYRRCLSWWKQAPASLMTCYEEHLVHSVCLSISNSKNHIFTNIQQDCSIPNVKIPFRTDEWRYYVDTDRYRCMELLGTVSPCLT